MTVEETTLTRGDIAAIGTAVGQAVGAAIAPVIRESMEAANNRTDSLRKEVFDAMGKRVSRDECARTHAALPPVAILGAIGASGVVSSLIGYLVTR